MPEEESSTLTQEQINSNVRKCMLGRIRQFNDILQDWQAEQRQQTARVRRVGEPPEEKRLRLIEANRARIARYKSEGLCACGKRKPVEGKKTCQPCLDRSKAFTARRKAALA